MRVNKTGVGAEEGEALRVGHGLGAVAGEVGDDVFFPGVEGFHVHGGGGDAQAEGGGVLGVVENVGRVEEGFGGHTALQDAEAAELFGTVNDGDAFAEVGGDAGGVEAGGAAAEDDEVEGGFG